MKKLKKGKYIIIPMVALLSSLITGCHHKKEDAASLQPAKETTQIITVQAQPQSTTLYFTSSVNPLNVINVPSPVTGLVDHVYFHYGQRVQKNDLLVSIRSDSLLSEYQNTLSNYLRAKDSYANSEQQASANVALFKAGLISKNTNESSQQNLANSYLSFMQAKISLETMIQNSSGLLNDEGSALANLDLENMDAVRKAFTMHINEMVIRAPTYGIILTPQANGGLSAGGTVSNRSRELLSSGASVRKNTTVISIGDLTGLSLTISVNEININNIQPGQPVTVTGVAFPNLTLQGYVSSVGAQASQNPNGGLPVFPVAVIIPNISKEAQKIIHIGMTSKISLTLQLPPTISVPLNAVTMQNGQTVVMRVNPKTNKTEPVVVSTGQTTMDSVIISAGLANGDKILVTN